jgi:hypothetical protein
VRKPQAICGAQFRAGSNSFSVVAFDAARLQESSPFGMTRAGRTTEQLLHIWSDASGQPLEHPPEFDDVDRRRRTRKGIHLSVEEVQSTTFARRTFETPK